MHYVAPSQRLVIEQQLRTVVEQAQREYREALMTKSGKVSLGPRAQGGTVIATAPGDTRLAHVRERYQTALEAFTNCILHGKVSTRRGGVTVPRT